MKPLIRTALLLVSMAAVTGLSGNTGGEKTLKFYHTHTGKSLRVTYSRQGEYAAEAFTEIRAFLADWRDGEQHDMDPQLMDILWQLQQGAGSTGTWDVISAYRSPKTNEMLRGRSSGVASKSQHLLGKAIDVRLRGVPTDTLRDAALALQRGGVGYYEKSDFVHMDTGRVRRW